MRYWTGWQQVHEHLAKQTERPPTVLSAGGSGVPYSRRTVVESTWLVLVRDSARVVGSPSAHSGSSRGSRGGRGWDTTMVARRV